MKNTPSEDDDMKTVYVKPKEYVRKWYLIDAEGRTLGSVAAAAATILRGKNKPEYVPYHDLGDYVVIVNAEKIILTGNKMNTKEYIRHSMYPGGLKRESIKDVLKRKPTFPIEKAVKGMLPKGPLGRSMFLKLKAYAGPEHPHAGQNPVKIEIH